MADITTHLDRLAKTAMDLEIPVLLEAKEEILALRQKWHVQHGEIERLREALREITTPAYEYLSGEGAARHKIEIARTALEEKE